MCDIRDGKINSNIPSPVTTSLKHMVKWCNQLFYGAHYDVEWVPNAPVQTGSTDCGVFSIGYMLDAVLKVDLIDRYVATGKKA